MKIMKIIIYYNNNNFYYFNFRLKYVFYPYKYRSS